MAKLDEILARAAQRQVDLDQMTAEYEAIDAEEYAAFNAEMDARDDAAAESGTE